MILKKMKEHASEKLGCEVTDCVITCPAYFNDAQRNSTREAGIQAGFNVRAIIDEPTATALNFMRWQRGLPRSNLIVVDHGGGSFDVTIITIDNGIAEILATHGDAWIGG